MKKILLFILLLSYTCVNCLAQIYKYIGVEEGLSNRRVYSIKKDKNGYMWFLTRDGIDRYNGSEFVNYKLQDGFEVINSMFNVNWLCIDANGNAWMINRIGTIFEYDTVRDNFNLVHRFSTKEGNPRPEITYSFIDKDNIIWLFGNQIIYKWDIANKKISEIESDISSNITKVLQSENNYYIVGTDDGIHYAEIKNNKLKSNIHTNMAEKNIVVKDLYYDPKINKLFIGTARKGILVYDTENYNDDKPFKQYLTNVSINAIRPLNDHEILFATDGEGIFKINTNDYNIVPYIMADYNEYNRMNGNAINDVYVDEERRLWMAVFPVGITMLNYRFPEFKMIKHSIGNSESIINDQVNGVFEDSDGDVWYATGNGISLHETKTNKWHNFFSIDDNKNMIYNHIFLTVCEVSPGVIWGGGYNSDIYAIDKNSFKTKVISFDNLYNAIIKPDKYIRCIYKDSRDDVWIGGFANFKRIKKGSQEVELYDIKSITCIIERNNEELWVGTRNGLYLLDKDNKTFTQIHLPMSSTLIYTLYQDKKGHLYIGTSNSGLLYYDPENNLFKHYHSNNSSLISNNIHTLLADKNEDNLIIGTENGITRLYLNEDRIRNWTKDQGLVSSHFNALSGAYLKSNNSFILGTNNGAINFKLSKSYTPSYKNKIVLSKFRINYELVEPGDPESPLTTNINNTTDLVLENKQNIFSLNVSSINYDYQSDVLYSWKMEGLIDRWTNPGRDNFIRYTSLPPGKYKLRIRAISKENNENILEERSINISVKQPLWLSLWAICLYVIIALIITLFIIRFFISKRKRLESEEKIQFFINSSHDIRTPLSLIKAPLEEMRDQETLSQNGVVNMNIAIRNVNALLRLTTNLINFERADVYSPELYISEHELNHYLNDVFSTFQSYAQVKHINFTLETNFKHLNVWFDKDKMDSILKNIISNALKYTPENGSVLVKVDETSSSWVVEVKDTGIGIPSSEQRNLFKIHFRGSNAINSKVVGSGIGLMLVWKLVKLHDGKINFKSKEHKGSTITITFPKESKQLRKASKAVSNKGGFLNVLEPYEDMSAPSYGNVQQNVSSQKQRLLIVEDNNDLRQYLKHTLSESYIIQTAQNGKEALAIVKAYNPDLIVSDIMMPEMRGDEFCRIIKKDIETSHIPLILLTALNDEKSILKGLDTGADEYISKPFNIAILKATILNLLVNRSLLRQKYANLEIVASKEDNIDFSSDLDWNFINTVKKKVEDNLDNQEFNVDSLCNLLNMSRTSFYNKIKALTNQAPADYIRAIRLNRAAELLKTGKYSVIEVADMTGYNDAKYFREVFKKHFNVSPSKYAKAGDNDE